MPDQHGLLAWQPTVTRITEQLIRVAAGVGGADFTKEWGPTEWRIARVAASIHGLFPLLYIAQAPALANWNDFLARQYELTRQRNERLLGLAHRYVAAAEKRGLSIIPLKGAHLLTSYYKDIGLRPTSDIDVLVRPDELAGAIGAAEEVGWRLLVETDRHAVFVISPDKVVTMIGEHPDNPIKLEVHTTVSDPVLDWRSQITDALWHGAQDDVWRGIRVLLPTKPTVALHLAHHAAMHMRTRTLRFVQLRDLLLLSRLLGSVDWSAFVAVLDGCHGQWWAYPPLALLEAYFPGSLPASLLTSLRRTAPPGLRALSAYPSLVAVSCCNLNLLAVKHRFAWAPTPAHMMCYVTSLLLPSEREVDSWFVLSNRARPWFSRIHYVKDIVRILRRHSVRSSAMRSFGWLMQPDRLDKVEDDGKIDEKALEVKPAPRTQI